MTPVAVGDTVRVRDWPGINPSREYFRVASFRQSKYYGESADLIPVDRHGYPTHEPVRYVPTGNLVVRKTRTREEQGI